MKMRFSPKKNPLLFLPLLIACLCLAACDATAQSDSAYPPANSYPAPIRGRELTAQEVAEDAAWLIKLVEETHPSFLDLPEFDGLPSAEYEEHKAEFLERTSVPMSVGEFQMLCSYYTSPLNDAHTVIQSPPAGEGPMPGGRLQLSFYWSKEGLKLLPTEEYPGGAEVVAINGMDVEEIGLSMDLHSSDENESGRYYYRSKNVAARTHHQVAGLETGETAELLLVLPDGSSKVGIFPYEVTTTSATPLESWQFSLLENDTIALVTSNRCVKDERFTEVLAELQQAVQSGITKIIVDVRENQGGDSTIWNSFAEIMGLEGDMAFGFIHRNSPLLKSKTPPSYWDSNEYTVTPSRCVVSNAPEWDLVVLTSETTFSSSMFLLGFVKDGELGTILGRTPRNNLNSFGSPATFALPNSHLRGQVCTMYWLRPDPSRDEKTEALLDIELPYGVDALDEALALFAQ